MYKLVKFLIKIGLVVVLVIVAIDKKSRDRVIERIKSLSK